MIQKLGIGALIAWLPLMKAGIPSASSKWRPFEILKQSWQHQKHCGSWAGPRPPMKEVGEKKQAERRRVSACAVSLWWPSHGLCVLGKESGLTCNWWKNWGVKKGWKPMNEDTRCLSNVNDCVELGHVKGSVAERSTWWKGSCRWTLACWLISWVRFCVFYKIALSSFKKKMEIQNTKIKCSSFYLKIQFSIIFWSKTPKHKAN